MKIFDGKEASEKILDNLREKIERKKIKPTLAVIFIGKNPESKLYIENKKRAARNIGIDVSCYNFKGTVSQKKIIKKIEDLNRKDSIDGIIVQLPLPKKFNTDKVISSLSPKKDVDGFHKENRRLLERGRPYFFPVLPQAILMALKKSSRDLKRKNIVALVNSDIFGNTLKTFFNRKGVKIRYLLKKKCLIWKIKQSLKEADAIISVLGRPGFIKGEMIKKGVILIDAGIRMIKGKVKGDVDRDSVREKASFLTPVPGGIGPLTVSFLLKNVYLAAQKNK